MKKKTQITVCVIALILLLCACGRGQAETVHIAPSATPAPAATPAPTPTFAPAQISFPTPVPVPAATPTPSAAQITIPTPVPVPAATPTPVQTPAPTAAPSNLPRITKNPTDETVPVNGKCQFVSRYENAELAEWHFVSADGSLDVTYKDVQLQFPSLGIIGGNTKDLTLENIPMALNGCRVYCRFSNRAGSVDTGSARITVVQTPASAAAPAQSSGFTGTWTEEIAGRCSVTLDSWGEGSVRASIVWSGSAWERRCWDLVASAYGDDLMIYTGGHSWVETWYDDFNYTVSEESYSDSGSFSLRGGKLHWYDDQTGQDTVLVRH